MAIKATINKELYISSKDMEYLFELSKEHKTLPKAEVISCLNAENIKFKLIKSNYDVIILDISDNVNFLKIFSNRLSHTFFINKYLFSCLSRIDDIQKYAQENPVEDKGSIAIKYRNRSKNINSKKIIKALASIYSKNRKVSLKKPDIEIRALITDSKVYVGKKEIEINRSLFERRKVQNRPFFSPISLHPKLARSLVNLSGARKNDVLLDPFCGTGGILVEAGLIGIKVIGSDIEDKMIQGSKETLDYFNIKNYELFCTDIGNISSYVNNVDAVVTDLPYGKSTTTKGEDKNKLYSRSFEHISNVLKDKKRAVVGLSNKDMISIGKKYFSLKEIHEYKAHRSLTRYFCVYQKEP